MVEWVGEWLTVTRAGLTVSGVGPSGVRGGGEWCSDGSKIIFYANSLNPKKAYGKATLCKSSDDNMPIE